MFIDNSQFVLSRPDRGWTLHAPGTSALDIATGAVAALVTGETEPQDLDYAAARIKTAPTLAWLHEALMEFEAALRKHYDESEVDVEQLLGAYDINIAELKNFGGGTPESTDGVWSWDETYLLVGEGPFDEWTVKERQHDWYEFADFVCGPIHGFGTADQAARYLDVLNARGGLMPYSVNKLTDDDAAELALDELAESDLLTMLKYAAAPAAGSVFDYFKQTLGQEPNEQTLKELEIDTVCGADCCAVIDAAAAYLKVRGRLSQRMTAPMFESVNAAVEVLWLG